MVNQLAGPNLVNMLLVLFVAFKLAGIISWGWLWVLSPVWITLAVALVSSIAIGVVKGVRRSDSV